MDKNFGGTGRPKSRQAWALEKDRKKTHIPFDVTKLANLQFKTRKEVDLYLSGDGIECLICGKLCLALGHHLSKKHGVMAREYKKVLGLPMSRGLSVASIIKLQSERGKRFQEEGVLKSVPREHHQYSHTGCQPPFWYNEQKDKALAKVKKRRKEDA